MYTSPRCLSLQRFEQFGLFPTQSRARRESFVDPSSRHFALSALPLGAFETFRIHSQSFCEQVSVLLYDQAHLVLTRKLKYIHCLRPA